MILKSLIQALVLMEFVHSPLTEQRPQWVRDPGRFLEIQVSPFMPSFKFLSMQLVANAFLALAQFIQLLDPCDPKSGKDRPAPGTDRRRWIKIIDDCPSSGPVCQPLTATGYQSRHDRRRLDRFRDVIERKLQQAALIHGRNRTGNTCRKLLQDIPKQWTFLSFPGDDSVCDQDLQKAGDQFLSGLENPLHPGIDRG